MSSETRRAYIKMSTETLWHSYESTAPDSDETVLLHLDVVHWAHFPQPPEAA
jgi:hypothetical protein